MAEGFDALTEKEKETLRLMVRGHDAKSMARELSLSVHTINDRLRAARRKLGVTSSREAARLVFEHEAEIPEKHADKDFGDVEANSVADVGAAPGRVSPGRKRQIMTGVILMFAIVAALLLATQATVPEVAPATSGPSTEAPVSTIARSDTEVENAARVWLALVDKGDWRTSFDAAGKRFREPITLEIWADDNLEVRAPLGTVIAREAVSFQQVAGQPGSFQMIRFQSDFENRKGVIETVMLEHDAGRLKVVGYFID